MGGAQALNKIGGTFTTAGGISTGTVIGGRPGIMITFAGGGGGSASGGGGAAEPAAACRALASRALIAHGTAGRGRGSIVSSLRSADSANT